MVPACSSVNIRTGTSTGSAIKASLTAGSTVTVVAKVSGSSWSATCPTPKSGSGWYRISAVNGRSVSSLYGVSYLYAATGVLKTAPVATPGTATTLTDSSTFYGRGYGHGVGLSQYGARGRALAGQAADEILAHYYPGTTVGSLSADTMIRVLVLNDFTGTSSAPLTVIGRGGSWGLLGETDAWPADAFVRFIPNTGTVGWRLVIEDSGGAILRDGPAPTSVRLEPRDLATTLQLLSNPATTCIGESCG